MGVHRARRSAGQSAKKPPRMVVRMALMAASEGGGMQSWVKWRTKRELRGCLPPPAHGNKM